MIFYMIMKEHKSITFVTATQPKCTTCKKEGHGVVHNDTTTQAGNEEKPFSLDVRV